MTKPSGRSLPEFVTQKEVTGLQDKHTLTDTANAAVLTDGDACLALLVFSVYGSKPVHFLLIVATEIKRITKDRGIFDYKVDISVSFKFVWTNMEEV